MPYLLDTNILIGLLRGNKTILHKYSSMVASNHQKFISVYTILEIYYGLYNSENKLLANREQKIIELMMDEFQSNNSILSSTRLTVIQYAKLCRKLKEQGTLIPILDLLIGSIAVTNKLILITNDTAHFELLRKIEPSFQVEFWNDEKE